MKYRKIKENILYAGMNDEDRLIFDELIPLDNGTSYNSYIVIGSEKTAVEHHHTGGNSSKRVGC